MEKMMLTNGVEIDLTLKYSLLMKLRTMRPNAYKNYNTAAFGGSKKEKDTLFDAINIVYAAYLCGCIQADTLAGAMTYDEFLDVLPEDQKDVLTESLVLTNPKLKEVLGTLSANTQAALETAASPE